MKNALNKKKNVFYISAATLCYGPFTVQLKWHVLKRFLLKLQSTIIIVMFLSSMLGECIKHVLLITVITPTVTVPPHLQRRQLEFRLNVLSNDYNPLCRWL